MVMDGRHVETGAAPLFSGGGGSFLHAADDKVVDTTMAATPSTSYGLGAGGFRRNGTTPTPSEAAAFAEAAFATSY